MNVQPVDLKDRFFKKTKAPVQQQDKYELKVIKLDITEYQGPMDLLFSLIEKNRVDIYNIPIAEITEQYLDVLKQLNEIDVALASEFLLMAATLLHIKSKFLLPQKYYEEAETIEDPRDELVLRLLAYKRCRFYADELEKRYTHFSKCYYKLAETPHSLGIKKSYFNDEIDLDRMLLAISEINTRNQNRFNLESRRIEQILKRKTIFVEDQIDKVMAALKKKKTIIFKDIFTKEKHSKIEIIVGFLALLELLKRDMITIKQDRAFSDITIILKK